MRKISILFSCILIMFLINSISAETTKNNKLIGVILPFTSAFEGIANEQKEAIELAMQDFNDYDVIFEDSKSDAAGAIAAFKNLMKLENPPFAVISCASWVATVLHPLAAEADVFHNIIASASFKRTDPKHTIRFTLDASQEEKQLSNFLNKFDRIAIYNMDNGYGNGWESTIQSDFKEKIVKSIAYDPQNKDFEDDLMSIKAANPDALVMLSAGNGALIAKQAREIGITAQFVGTRPIERPELLKEPQYTNGLVFTYPTYDESHPMNASFAEKYGYEPTIFGVEAYDSITSLIKSAESGNHSTSALFNSYAGSTYIGALGEIHFDEIGDAHYPYMYKEIVNGKFVTAIFQYDMLLDDARQELITAFQKMGENDQERNIMLSEPDLIEKVISRKVTNFPIEILIMQIDGTIIYDDNREEIGLNTFTNDIYADYPSLIKIAHAMSENAEGKGEFEFLDLKMSKKVSKKIIWKTLTINNTDYRIALTHLN